MSLSSAVSTVSILCCVALVVALLGGVYAGELFPWHPIFMGLGFLGFMCEGIISAYRLRASDGAPRVAAIQNHMWVQLASMTSIILGFWVIYLNKTLHGKAHFTSLHGKTGLITTFLAVGVPVLGAFSFRRLGLHERLPPEWQPFAKWAHRLLGAVTWILAIVNMQLALPHPAVLEGFACRAWQAAAAGLGVGMLAMLRRPPPGKPVLPQTDFTAVPQAAMGPKYH